MKQKIALVFEDDPHVLEIYEIVLQGMGFHVNSSMTSHDVLERVEKSRPDLIIMDNWIPDIGGVQATQLLKQHDTYNKIPVLYVSANTEVESLSKMARADAYLAKPFSLDELEGQILAVLEGSTI